MTTAIQNQNKITTKGFFEQSNVKAKFEELLGKKSQGFITSVLQVVASNDLLKKADPVSIFNAAATAATLDLPINNNLGFAYIVPYGGKAQFQLGYKGFIQLAQRSGQFNRISATPIYEGQIKSENPLTGYEFDFSVVPVGEPIGYAAYFRLINGFEATLYMKSSEIATHGKKYSKTFQNGVWKTDFNAMATKTVIKLLLSRFAPLSIEMQTAIKVDQAVINNDDATDLTYSDHEEIEPNKEAERLIALINDCTSIDSLIDLQPVVMEMNNEEVNEAYSLKSQSF